MRNVAVITGISFNIKSFAHTWIIYIMFGEISENCVFECGNRRENKENIIFNAQSQCIVLSFKKNPESNVP